MFFITFINLILTYSRGSYIAFILGILILILLLIIFIVFVGLLFETKIINYFRKKMKIMRVG